MHGDVQVLSCIGQGMLRRCCVNNAHMLVPHCLALGERAERNKNKSRNIIHNFETCLCVAGWTNTPLECDTVTSVERRERDRERERERESMVV